MNLKPQLTLSEEEINKGLRLVIWDGLMSEAMTALTTGAFLVAMALLMGASNFQIGLLAALPTFTNIFQLLSIWLVRRYNNRRAVSVICSLLARIPLVVVGVLVLIYSRTPIQVLILFLFFYYFFASIAGPGWNAWMKDLVPEKSLGTYFSKRSRYTQLLNVVLSVLLALTVDFVKTHYPAYELATYAGMFILAGAAGVTGAIILSRTPEPATFATRENVFKLFWRSLKDANFRSLLWFNSAWVFALNIATPFFTVFLLQTMQLPLSYIIGLTIISQLCSILTIRIWGAFSDRYSNKTIIAIGAPLYILCIVAFCFVGIYTQLYANLVLLVVIYIFSGISTAGINLSLTNIGLKLAPRDEAIVYLSVRNMVTAIFSSIAPLLGGYLADYFNQRSLIIDIQWAGPKMNKVFHLVSLHQWNFLFLIGALLGLIAVQLLVRVKETGEVEKDVVVRIMRSTIKNNLKEHFIVGQFISWRTQFKRIIRKNGMKERSADTP